MSPSLAATLAGERARALEHLCELFMVVPPKKIDVYLAPARAALGGPYVFPEVWMALDTWYGRDSEEDLAPGRLVSELFVYHLAGSARKPHPFVLAGIRGWARFTAPGKTRRSLSPHRLFVARARADGVSGPFSIDGAALRAGSDFYRLMAASFFDFIVSIGAEKSLAALPGATAVLDPRSSDLRPGFARVLAAAGTGTAGGAALVAQWNRVLSRISPALTRKNVHFAAVTSVLDGEGEDAVEILPYRDSPALRFVARTASDETYLVGYVGGAMKILKRLRHESPRFESRVLGANRRTYPSVPPSVVRRVEAMMKARVEAVRRDDVDGLARGLAFPGCPPEQARARAERLVRQLRKLKVRRVSPAWLVESEVDLGPSLGRSKVLSLIGFHKGHPVVYHESWDGE